jgi:uncharacterized protein YjbI with pentapeptide repeats
MVVPGTLMCGFLRNNVSTEVSQPSMYWYMGTVEVDLNSCDLNSCDLNSCDLNSCDFHSG